jgi:hypothetical protein
MIEVRLVECRQLRHELTALAQSRLAQSIGSSDLRMRLTLTVKAAGRSPRRQVR